MRILAWMETHYPVIGGIQTAARQLLPALRERGHEVVIVASHFALELPDVTMQDGIPVHRFHFYDALANHNALLFMQERQRVTKFMREFSPDVVHVMGFGPSGIFFIRSRQSYKVPFLFTIHNEDSARFDDAHGATLLRQFLTEAAWITTVSQIEARRTAALLPEVATKISCVYQGLAQPKEPLLAHPTQPRLLCIGRMEEQKNFALAIQAFARIVHTFADARLIFAGDGTERPMLEQLVKELGIAAQVDFLGWVQPERIPTLISQASAVVLPSRWEGLPLAGVEAAQMARPLIATSVSGTPELVVDGETGLLIPPADVDALAAAMHTLLSDPLAAAQMGQAAHAHIYSKFSLEGMVDAFSILYERILAASACSSDASFQGVTEENRNSLVGNR